MAIDTQKFVRKPLYVDAVRVSVSNFDDIREWCRGKVEYEPQDGQGPAKTKNKKYIKVWVLNPKHVRQTQAFVGDWLLYTEKGFKVYTNNAFRMAFEKVDDIAEDKCAPLFYIDPATGFITDEAPHEHAMALSFDELIYIIRKEIHSERHYARIEAAKNGQPDPLSTSDENTSTDLPEMIQEVAADILDKADEESPRRDEQMPSEPAGVVDTSVPVSPIASEPVQHPAYANKTVLSLEDQQEMDADEIRELVQSGEAILAQDLQT